jgi:hypothetical protein
MVATKLYSHEWFDVDFFAAFYEIINSVTVLMSVNAIASTLQATACCMS